MAYALHSVVDHNSAMLNPTMRRERIDADADDKGGRDASINAQPVEGNRFRQALVLCPEDLSRRVEGTANQRDFVRRFMRTCRQRRFALAYGAKNCVQGLGTKLSARQVSKQERLDTDKPCAPNRLRLKVPCRALRRRAPADLVFPCLWHEQSGTYQAIQVLIWSSYGYFASDPRTESLIGFARKGKIAIGAHIEENDGPGAVAEM